LLEDTQIIARVKAGDTEFFSEIIERYQIPIFRYLYRLTGNYENAKDLRQDTFMQAYQGILKNDIRVSFKAWLYRIATNNVLQLRRRKRILSFIPFLEGEEKDLNKEDPPSKFTAEQLEIQDILGKLPEEQRICMVLHFVEGFKYREIADTLGISEEAVRKRVTRGSQVFKRLYSCEEVG
jgi:RNA polymerase sigma factor (sigma-70 family)